MDNNKSVLIIDDDVDFLMMISVVLGNRGFRVKCLLNGETNDVLQHAQQSDIVLLDIELPGINGVDIGRQLKADSHTENVPIILISGHADGKRILKASGADAFIEKPFALSGLFSKIDELLAA